eukprot:CAMPEP_0170301492 /NCGR_PEP_ID=MMETSP0116_2-20130129/51010_1 /TAXON_ID=400756 /ORGANISM="Durinskia baltica, Strain CSIRO CS-38" /LENGTH=73 /DNA_ID=CAMNT_0010553323 /DNA_START=146 /DNA_END=367 /DNA_ORIENTATION=+
MHAGPTGSASGALNFTRGPISFTIARRNAGTPVQWLAEGRPLRWLRLQRDLRKLRGDRPPSMTKFGRARMPGV